MRLIYISHWRFPAEKTHAAFAMKTCEMFVKYGFNVELWVPRRNNKLYKEDPFLYHGIKQKFTIRRIPVVDLTGVFPGSCFFFLMVATFNASLFLYALFRRLPGDTIFYGHDIRDVVLWVLLGHPIFIEIHDFYKSGAKWINRRIFPRIAGFIVTNHFKIEVLKKDFSISEDRMFYQPNAVDVQMFSLDLAKDEARSKLGLPRDQKIILYTGHLFDWKGVDTLFDSHEFLGPDEIIYFVGGTDEDIRKFKVSAKGGSASGGKSEKLKTENVVVVGRRPHQEIPLWLRAADVLVLPNSAKHTASKYETSPVKLFEYMASGTPIVSSDLPSIRDILDERMAFFFKPDDSRSLAEAVHHILGRPLEAEARAKKAFEQVKNYTWEKRTESIINFLQTKFAT